MWLIAGVLFIAVGVIVITVGPALAYAIGEFLGDPTPTRRRSRWAPVVVRIAGYLIVGGGAFVIVGGLLGWL